MWKELKSGYSKKDLRGLMCVLCLSSEKIHYITRYIYAQGDTTLFLIGCRKTGTKAISMKANFTARF